MALSNLPDISFADFDEETVKNEVINQYEAVSGRHLADGDPVRLFLLAIANLLILQRNLIDHTGKMNLLAYATGDYLDHLGALLDVERIPATKARTTVLFTLSTPDSGAIIPKGTRITTADEKAYFATEEPLLISVGDTTGTIPAICLDAGEIGNGIREGSLSKLVDPIPYVAAVQNTTVTAGGTEKEDDESYRERIHEAPESFSDAGSRGAYIFFAKSANADIADVTVSSPSPGKVKIVPLLKDGKIPEKEVLDEVAKICNAEKVRPLTDHVTVAAPTTISYQVDASYCISTEDKAQAEAIQKKVNEAVETYKNWQGAKLGRDLDPSKLCELMVRAGARKVSVNLPALTILADSEIAVASDTKVTFKGVDDG